MRGATVPTGVGRRRRRGLRLGRRSASGFTLVELLVVIGIIVVLAGILLPTINRAWRSAVRARHASDLQAVATGLEAYKRDFGDIPRVRFAPGVDVTKPLRPNPPTGAQILCLALIGPSPETDTMVPPPGPTERRNQDGATGAGFRTRPNGKIYPPYLADFKFGDPSDVFGPSATAGQELRFCLLDRNGKPILYFPANPAKINVRATGAMPAPYVDADTSGTNPPNALSEGSRYDGNDNLIWFTHEPNTYMLSTTTVSNIPVPELVRARKRLRGMLGDLDSAPSMLGTGNTTPDGVIQSYESEVDMPYLLWSAGSDQRFGPEQFVSGTAFMTPIERSLLQSCDDVTNFR